MFDLFRLHRDQHLLPMIDLAKVENHHPSHRDVNNKIDLSMTTFDAPIIEQNR